MASKPNPAKPAKPAAEKTYPHTEVIERRIKSGERNLLRPRQVTLVRQDEPMTTRIVNTAIDSRWHQITAELGWVAVEPHEVAGGLPQGDMRADGNRVVMGEGGREVLVKMPTAAYEQIQQARARREDKSMRSRDQFQDRVKKRLEEEAKAGDKGEAEGLERAADAVSGLEVETFQVSKERVPIRPLDE